MRFQRLFLVAACSVTFSLPVMGQSTLDTPLTKLEPVKYHSGFIRELAERYWNLVPVSDYHHAAVKISCPTGYGGSGGIVKTDKGLFVTTNHHVIAGCENRNVNILTLDGRKITGKVIWWDQRADVAVIYHPQGLPYGFPIYDAELQPGQTVEVCGFGGPGRLVPKEDLRPFRGKVLQRQYSAAICVDAYTVSGDSGASILYDGAVCGVNWGHYDHPKGQVQGWSVGKPLSSNVDGRWLAKTLTQICSPYGCRPVIRGPGQVVIQPPANAPQPATPAQPPAAQPSGCDCDTDALKQAIIDELKGTIKGDPGPQGEQGPAGPQGPPGQSVTTEQLGAIAAAITEQLKADPSLRGEQGAPGKDGRDGKDAIVTPEQLRQAVADYFAANPQTISLALIDGNGNEIDRDTVEIGGTLKLQFEEIK